MCLHSVLLAQLGKLDGGFLNLRSVMTQGWKCTDHVWDDRLMLLPNHSYITTFWIRKQIILPSSILHPFLAAIYNARWFFLRTKTRFDRLIAHLHYYLIMILDVFDARSEITKYGTLMLFFCFCSTVRRQSVETLICWNS